MSKGFLGDMRMFDNIELSKNWKYVSITNTPALTKEMVIRTLNDAKIAFTDFEEYLEHLKTMESINGISDKSMLYHR